MQRLLVLFESIPNGRPPAPVHEFARGAASTGLDVRLRSLSATGRQDLRWAHALGVGLLACSGGGIPWAVKRWMDRVGFEGWSSLEGKPGCVLAGFGGALASDERALVLVASLLKCRGMATCSIAGDARPRGGDDAAAGVAAPETATLAEHGHRFAGRLVQNRLANEPSVRSEAGRAQPETAVAASMAAPVPAVASS